VSGDMVHDLTGSSQKGRTQVEAGEIEREQPPSEGKQRTGASLSLRLDGNKHKLQPGRKKPDAGIRGSRQRFEGVSLRDRVAGVCPGDSTGSLEAGLGQA
jgi:hypothetical protein